MSSDNCNRVMMDLKDTLDWMDASNEDLMEGVVAGKMGARAEFNRRVPEGCLIVWRER